MAGGCAPSIISSGSEMANRFGSTSQRWKNGSGQRWTDSRMDAGFGTGQSNLADTATSVPEKVSVSMFIGSPMS